MSEEEILEKAISKSGQDYSMKLSGVPLKHSSAYYSIIFSHGFARSFFGEEWEFHIQKMVTYESPIKYLEQFLK